MLSTAILCLGLAASSLTLTNAAAVFPRGSGGSKKGLAYNDASLCAKFPTDSISWGYDWQSEPRAVLDGGREYVPMCWGERSFATWRNNADAAVAKGAKHFLGFNEPDIPSQANMSPQQAAEKYRQYMMPYAGKVQLGAPAVTNSGTPGQGLDWLRQFLQACHDCTIDFVPMHWYDVTGNVDYFKKHMNDARGVAGGRKLWLTEFGVPSADQGRQVNFLRAVLPWMDAQPWIERYCYYGVFEGLLLQGGSVSAAGSAYSA